MPPTGKQRGGWHIPGKNYCGPFTNLKSNEPPVDEIDECCQQHDHHYASQAVSTREADDQLINCVGRNHPIGLIFRGKRAFDSLTGDASDAIFRPDKRSKSNAEISQLRARQNRIRATKRAATETSARTRGDIPVNQQNTAESIDEEGNIDVMDNEVCDDPEISEPPNKRTKRSIGDGNAGVGGGVSGGPNNMGEIDRPFGQESLRTTRTYKKSFITYVDNGLAGKNSNFGWKYVQVAAATAGDNYTDYVEWNEGWQVVPWGILAGCLSRHDLNMLELSSRRWRVKKFGVELEGMIPFQNVLTGTGTRESVTTFSNRPNMHIYVDDNHLLPGKQQWPVSDIVHNDWFGQTWSNHSNSKLKSPKFKFFGMKPSQWKQKSQDTPSQNEPAQIFSLYNTGKVYSMYPGQKFSREYHIMNPGWQGRRGTNDRNVQLVSDTQRHTTTMLSGTYSLASMEPVGGSFERADGATPVVLNKVLEAWKDSPYTDMGNNAGYVDTGLPVPHRAAPHILCKMEPYYGPDDVAMDIFAQLHVHYWCEIEFETLDGYGNLYDPTDYSYLGNTANTHQQGDNYLAQALAFGPNDNELGRLGNFKHETVAYA